MWLKVDIVEELDKIRWTDVRRKIGLSDLQDGEFICDECQGSLHHVYLLPCFKCRGTGKIDWIDNILGKKGNYVI